MYNIFRLNLNYYEVNLLVNIIFQFITIEDNYILFNIHFNLYITDIQLHKLCT